MSDTTMKIPLIPSDVKKNHYHQRNKQSLSKLYIASGICFFFMVVEIIGGFLANSLAIMTDAAHMFSDLSGFAISITSLYIAARPASTIMSYGYHRAEIIGASISVALIWGLTIWLVYEAILRIQSPRAVDGWIMMITALIGLLSNIVMGVILHSSHSHSNLNTSHDHAHEEDVNIKAATLHVLGDLIQSIGVIMAAGIILWNPEWSIADPICTFVFSILVTLTTFPIIKKCIGILMEGSPIDVDIDALYVELLSIDEVKEVHDLHVWSLSLGKNSMSCHLIARDTHAALQKATYLLQNKYGINHNTIQVENSDNQEFSCDNTLH